MGSLHERGERRSAACSPSHSAKHKLLVDQTPARGHLASSRSWLRAICQESMAKQSPPQPHNHLFSCFILLSVTLVEPNNTVFNSYVKIAGAAVFCTYLERCSFLHKGLFIKLCLIFLQKETFVAV